MKKNNYFRQSTNRQRLIFIVYNLIAYLGIFALLGAFIVFTVNNVFFEEARRTVYDYATDLKLGIATNHIRPPQDQLMHVAFFDGEGNFIINYYDDRIVEATIDPEVVAYETVVHEVIVQTVLYPEGTMVVDANYMTLVEEVDVLIETETAAYMKIYMNIDGEVHSRNQIISVYLFSIILILILSSAASTIMSAASIKPIMLSLEKQAAFVSDASHELRTPLAIIQSKLENIMADSTKTVVEVSEDIAISLKELSRLNKLTTDLLTLARNDNNSFKLDVEVVDVKELIEQAVEPFRDLANLQNKRFVMELDHFSAKIDRNKINQLVIILLDNALQYTNEEDLIAVVVKEVGSDFSIEVMDTGIGIREENRKRVFERFFREDKARSRSVGGNGLGLSIAKTIVTHHHGKIVCLKNEPNGTKFIVTLPKIMK